MLLKDVEKGEAYGVTRDDVLWLLRAVEAEGEPRAFVASTLVNGYMAARSRLGVTRPLAWWVRAYAQPVNPRWFPNGDLHREQLTKHPEKAAVLVAQADRRLLHSARTEFSQKTIKAVEDALTSRPVLKEATDYAAARIAKGPPWKLIARGDAQNNAFWTRPAFLNWRGYVPDSMPVGWAAKPALLLAVAALAFAAWRWG